MANSSPSKHTDTHKHTQTHTNTHKHTHTHSYTHRYGDLKPQTDRGKLFTVCFALFSLSAFGFVTSYIPA